VVPEFAPIFSTNCPLFGNAISWMFLTPFSCKNFISSVSSISKMATSKSVLLAHDKLPIFDLFLA